MSIKTDQTPFIQWELNEDGTRKTVQVLNEQIKITNNIVILNWKPNKYHRVSIENIIINLETVIFKEIELDEKIDSIEKFKVNYLNGTIYFHPSLEGYTLNISKYYSDGLILYHVSRIYDYDVNGNIITFDKVYDNIYENLESKIKDDLGEVNQELNQIVDEAQDKLDTLGDFALDLATATAELKSLQLLLQNANVNQESRQQITDAAEVVSLPKTAGAGGMPVALGGMTARNEIVNGDFAINYSGWFPVYLNTPVVSDGILSMTGTQKDARLYQSIPVLAEHKYYVACRFKANSNLVRIRDYTGGNMLLAHSGSGNFERKSTLYNAPSSRNWNLAIQDSRESGFDEIQVDYIAFINLTAQFGPGNEPDLATCDKLFATWFDGLKSVVAPRVRSVGKNLFDSERAIRDTSFFWDSGQPATVAGNLASDFIKVVIGATYTSKYFMQVMLYDKDKKFLRDYNLTSSAFKVFAISGNNLAEYVRIAYRSNDNQGQNMTGKNDLQLEQSVTPTPYEPYTESLLYPEPVTLRRLPNGVRDTVEGGKLIRRVREYVIQESDIVTFRSTWANVNTVQMARPADCIPFVDAIQPAIHMPAKIQYPFINLDSLAVDSPYINNYCTRGYQNVWFIFNKTVTSLAQAKSLLAGLTLLYELADPEITEHITSGLLTSEPSGTVYLEHALADAGMYTDRLTVLRPDFPIERLESVHKVDLVTGGLVPLSIATAVVASNGLSFTHPGLSAGDIVFFVYHYPYGGPLGENTYSVYDSRYTIKDSVTSKYYKWGIGVANGVPSINLVEV